MKRILMMLALAAFLVAALSVSALSAFADVRCSGPQGTGETVCQHGNAGKETQRTHGASSQPV
jgi:hypothetical protein